jgi:hypothetical protein
MAKQIIAPALALTLCAFLSDVIYSASGKVEEPSIYGSPENGAAALTERSV